ncbi:MAG: hypothetical protein EOO65_04050 [Methanosarcinales archaeon]|nr:MAG: hypothetical protein EOO65_04050 [Methanosarcinales archaeon]
MQILIVQLVGFDMSLAIRDELHAQVDATPPQLSADTFAEQYRLVQYLADNVDIVVANIQTAMTASGTTSVEQSVAEWLATASATLSVQPLRVVTLAAAPSSSAVAENVRSDDRALPLGIVIGAAAGGVALIVFVVAALLMLRPKKPEPPVLRSVASSARIRVVRAQGSGTTAAVPSGTTSPLRVYNRVQATGSFRQHSFDPLRV